MVASLGNTDANTRPANCRPHIVIVNDYAYVNGGAGKVALTSAVALANSGYSVTVFSAVLPVMHELNCNNLRVVNTGQYDLLGNPDRKKAALQGIWNFSAADEMGHLLDTLDPLNTIIHLHGWTKSLSSSVVRVAIQRGYKIVLTLHDYFLACPNGSFYNYVQNRICSLVPMSAACISTNCDVRSYSQKLWRMVRHAVQKNYGLMPRGISQYISVSEFSRSILEPFLPKVSHIHTVTNPIDTQKDVIVSAEKNNDYLYVGRLSPEKGVVLFAAVASQLGISAVFAGEGECRHVLEQLNSAPELTGWLNPTELTSRLRAARVLVLPSLWYETQGLVVLEAAALGVPALVPDTAAARDLVIDGKTGLWFKGGDRESLQEKLEMLQDSTLVQRLGRAAYDNYWANPCTMDRHLKQLTYVYREIIERKDARLITNQKDIE